MTARWSPVLQVILVFGVLALLIPLIIRGPKHIQEPEKVSNGANKGTKEKTESLLRIDLRNPRISELADGKELWSISARSVANNSTDKIIEFNDIEGKFYDQKQNPTMTFFAKNVALDINKRSFVISGGISIENKEMDTYLKAQRAEWQPERKTLVGSGDPIVMRRNGIQVIGERLEVDAEMKSLTLSGKVKIQLPVGQLNKPGPDSGN